MIKRFLSLVLCLCLLGVATVAFAEDPITTGVVDLTNAPNNEKVTDGDFGTGYSVNITAVAEDTAINVAPEVYSVEIVWGDMAFAYGYDAATDTAVWNPATHTYDVTENGGTTTATKGWYMVTTTDLAVAYPKQLAETDTFVKKTQDMVMVFNHSSLPVEAEMVINNDASVDEIADAGITAGLDASATDTAEKKLEVTEGDVYAEDSALVKQVVLSEPTSPEKIPTDKAVVAKLTVTISECEETTSGD